MRRNISLFERFFYTTLKLKGVDNKNQEITGTAFFYEHKQKNRSYLFLVANAHTVKEMEICRFSLHSKVNGKPDVCRTIDVKMEDFKDEWIYHPSNLDLAIMPVQRINDILEQSGDSAYIQSITSDLIPSEREINGEIQPLEDAYFIGYPNGIDDKVHNLPIARKGTVATPISVDYEEKPWFLFDGAIFPGSSGSPILMIDQNGYIDRNDVFIPERRIFFLGIVRSGYTYVDDRAKNGKSKRAKNQVVYRQMMDLGVAIKSNSLHEVVKKYLDENEESEKGIRLTTKIRNRLGLRIQNRIRKRLSFVEK
jgi:hypothetical protein